MEGHIAEYAILFAAVANVAHDFLSAVRVLNMLLFFKDFVPARAVRFLPSK